VCWRRAEDIGVTLARRLKIVEAKTAGRKRSSEQCLCRKWQHGRSYAMREPIKPIRNKKDHAAALAEVERLWGAKAAAPEAGNLGRGVDPAIATRPGGLN